MTEADGTAPERSGAGGGLPAVGLGIALGAGIGIVGGVLVGGGSGIALGAAIGSGLGVVAGAVWQGLGSRGARSD